jgi:hypothetical protein
MERSLAQLTRPSIGFVTDLVSMPSDLQVRSRAGRSATSKEVANSGGQISRSGARLG